MTVINLCHLLINFKLLSTTCAQPCTNCVPQRTQPYQYVLNVPVVPVQGVAVPANNPQQPCCGTGQTATQTVFWYNTGNGQQNSGMLSNFTAISPQQNQFNYQNPNGQQQQQGQGTSGNYMTPTTFSPVTPGSQFTTPAPNYNPDIYLQGTTPQEPTAQTLSPGGVPFVGTGNQPYNQGQGVTPGQVDQGGTYNSANSEFLAPQNEGLYQGGPVQGGTTQGNYFVGGVQQNQGQQFQGSGAQGGFQQGQQGQQGGQFTQGGQSQFQGQNQGNQFQGQQGNQFEGQGAQFVPGQQGGQFQGQGQFDQNQFQGAGGQTGQQGFQQGQFTGSPGGQGSQQTFTVGGQYTGPAVPGAQYQPNPSGGQVGSSGMVVSTVTYQGQNSGTAGAAGAVAAGAGVAGAAGAAANYNNQNPYLYSTSSMYSTTTPVPPRVSTTPGSTPGFQYSTQNPHDQYFGQTQGQGQPTQFTGGSPSPTSQFPSSQGIPSSTPGFTQQGSTTPFPSTLQYQTPFGGQPIGQQQGFGSTQGPFQQNEGDFGQQTNQQNNFPSSTPMPEYYPSSSSQFTQGYPSPTPSSTGYQGGFPSSTPGSTANQGSSMVGGYASTTPLPFDQQYSSTQGQASMVGGYAFTSPLPSQEQYQQQQGQGQQGAFTTSGPSTTPFTYVFPGAQQNFGGSSTPAGQTGTYPTGAQLDQSSTTRQPNVNVAGIGGGQQAGTTAATMGPTASSGTGASELGQDVWGTFVGSSTTSQPFYDSGIYNSAPNTGRGGIEGQGGQFGQGNGNIGPGFQGPAGSTGGGVAGFTPQYDFEHNMNTQYGHYNFTPTAGDGRMNDVPTNQQQQPQNIPTQTSGVITPLLVLALSVLLF